MVVSANGLNFDINSSSIILRLAYRIVEVHLAIICACLTTVKPFLRRHMPKVLGGSYHASNDTNMRTIHSTYKQHLSSRNAGDDPQGIILESIPSSKLRSHTWFASKLANNYDIERGPINGSTVTVELGTEQPVSTEHSSDKGLIIIGSPEAGDHGS